MQKFRGAWKFTAAVRPEYVIRDRIVSGKGTRIEDGRQVGAVIDMKMREQHDVHLVEIEIELADFNERAGTSIDKNARHARDRNDIARLAAPGRARSAGAEDDQLHRRFRVRDRVLNFG